jgi:hypothetical protein
VTRAPDPRRYLGALGGLGFVAMFLGGGLAAAFLLLGRAGGLGGVAGLGG